MGPHLERGGCDVGHASFLVVDSWPRIFVCSWVRGCRRWRFRFRLGVRRFRCSWSRGFVAPNVRGFVCSCVRAPEHQYRKRCDNGCFPKMACHVPVVQHRHDTFASQQQADSAGTRTSVPAEKEPRQRLGPFDGGCRRRVGCGWCVVFGVCACSVVAAGCCGGGFASCW